MKYFEKKGRPTILSLTVLVIKCYLIVYVLVIAVVFLIGNRLLFPATREMHGTPKDLHVDYEDLKWLVDGEVTNAWFIPAENAKGTILFSRGNGGTLSDWLDLHLRYRQLGFNVLAYDYGGYGNSTGAPSEARCYDDIRAAWHYLTETKGLPPNKIVLIGHSIGGGVTGQLAAEVKPAAVVLQSTFLSVPRLFQDHVRIFWVTPFVRPKFDTESKLGRFSSPILVIHSPDDKLIPYYHGRQLYDRANPPKDFLEIRGDHNEGLYLSKDAYEKKLAEFLEPLLQTK